VIELNEVCVRTDAQSVPGLPRIFDCFKIVLAGYGRPTVAKEYFLRQQPVRLTA
jgi:hypothetical protein